jgi:outer membrane protein, heavy metal efflux system
MTRRWLLPIPLLLAGCLGSQAYRQLRRDAASPAAPEYYLHEIGRPVIRVRPELADTALAEVKAHLEEEAKKWEQQDQATPTAPPGIPAATLREAAAVNADPARLAATLKGPLALPLLLALVQERNPRIAAAARDLRAAVMRYPQVTALDDLLRQYNAFTKQLDTLVTVQPQKAMTAMQFPFPDVAALKGQVVTLEVAEARIGLDLQTRDVLTEARLAWSNYAYLQAALALTRDNVGLLDGLARAVEARYQNSQSLYGDLLSAQMELAMVTEDERELRDRLEATAATLNALLGRPAAAELGPAADLPDVVPNGTLTELTDLALRQRQELVQQRVAIQRMETMRQMAARMAVPDPSAGASLLDSQAKIVSGTGAEPSTMGGMASGTFATQPRPDLAQAAQFGRESAYLRETDARIEAMQQMLADMENETRAMVCERRADSATAARRSQTLYRTSQIPLARQAVKAAEAAYSDGQADFMTYIEALRTLLRYQLEEEAARRDLRDAVARLDQVVGSNVPAQPAEKAPAP